MNIHIRFSTPLKGIKLIAAMLMLIATPVLTGCKENISEDAFSVAKKSNVIQILESQPEKYSEILKLFNEVKLGLSDNASSVESVLKARGNYTVFAPTNEAMQVFLREELGKQSINEMTDLQKRMVVYNCIIDNGTQAAYELSDFPADATTFNDATLDDRRLTSQQDSEGEYYVNITAHVISPNHEASNGMVHIVDHVIYPSSQSVPEIIAKADNMHIMGQLFKETGWKDSLRVRTTDEDAYVRDNQSEIGIKKSFPGIPGDFAYMPKRRIRYTVFAEPDEVLHREWGIPMPQYDSQTETITNWDEIREALLNKCEQVTGITAHHDDITHTDNALNRFLAYHIINGGAPINGLVAHYNEYRYNVGNNPTVPQTRSLPVNVWDYYTTMGPHRALLKVTQLGDQDPNHPFYLNRISQYDNRFLGSYDEISALPANSPTNGLNIRIHEKNESTAEDGTQKSFTTNALNGYYFPIDHVLVNSPETQAALGGERIRIDFTTINPEFLSNDLRITGEQVHFPKGYFQNISHESPNTAITYLHSKTYGGGPGWKDAQGDEILVTGTYDFVMKMPPVPADGTYEIRMGVANNRARSMVQIYFDDSPFPSTPTSLPIDQREFVRDWDPNLWVKDEKNNYDEATCLEGDRALKNLDYMKGPKYYCVNGTAGEISVRDYFDESQSWYFPNMRYIITRQHLQKDKTYYMRFKCAVESSTSQFFLDYFEYCPSSVYGSVTGEDVW